MWSARCCCLSATAASASAHKRPWPSYAAHVQFPRPAARPTGIGSAGGNRQANAALYRVVIVRLRAYQPNLDYVRRRTAEGKSKLEIIRCLKRFVAREIFGYLCRPANAKHSVLASP